jgi:hypothetical protein
MISFKETLKNFHKAKDARKAAQFASFDAEQAVQAAHGDSSALIQVGDAADESLVLASEQEVYWLRELRKFTAAQRAVAKEQTV